MSKIYDNVLPGSDVKILKVILFFKKSFIEFFREEIFQIFFIKFVLGLIYKRDLSVHF
jgi:hypothetical protein